MVFVPENLESNQITHKYNFVTNIRTWSLTMANIRESINSYTKQIKEKRNKQK